MKTRKNRIIEEEKKLTRALKQNTKVLKEVEEEVEQKGGQLLSKKGYMDSFVQGILYGLGIAAAAVIVIPIVIALLKNVQWVPLLGDAVTRIIDRVEQQRPEGSADYR